MNRRIWYLTAALLLGLGLFGLAEWRAIRRQRAATEMLMARRQQTAARIAKLQQRLKRLAGPDDPSAVRTARAPAAAASPRLSFRGSILELIRDDPQAQAWYFEAQRATLRTRYGPLWRSLGLERAMTDAFEANWLQREQTLSDLDAVLQTRGEESVSAVESMRADAERAYLDAQRKLLGDAGYAKLQEFEHEAGARQVASAIAGAAVVEHVPFTTAQVDALVAAIRSATSGGMRHVNWEAVDRQARVVLTPEQYRVYRTMDPGPSQAGSVQSRLYAAIAAAASREVGAGAEPPRGR